MSSTTPVGRQLLHINSSTSKNDIFVAMTELMDRIKKLTELNIKKVKNTCTKCVGTTISGICANCSSNTTNDFYTLPSFNDLRQTHRLLVCKSYRPFVSISSQYSKIGSSGTPTFGGSATFNLPLSGADFLSDCVVRVTISEFQAINVLDKVRYAEFVGHKLFQNVSFEHNKQIIDQYTTERYNLHWQMDVEPGKEEAYLRNIGQEVPTTAYFVPEPSIDEYREYIRIGYGPQTYKFKQQQLDLWIPLLFWFNKTEDALANYLLAPSSTQIIIQLSKFSDLMSFAPYSRTNAGHTTPTITNCELYMNGLYVSEIFMRIYRSRFQLKLIRINKTSRIAVSQSSHQIPLPAINMPVEAIFAGFKPDNTQYPSQDWHKNCYLVEHQINRPIVTSEIEINHNVCNYYTEVHPLANVFLETGTFQLFPTAPPSFYNSYISTARGPFNKAPKDIGWLQFIFSTDKETKELTGYLDASNTSTIYLTYTSDLDPTHGNLPYIRPSSTWHVDVIARCINFIKPTLQPDGTATLKLLYMT